MQTARAPIQRKSSLFDTVKRIWIGRIRPTDCSRSSAAYTRAERRGLVPESRNPAKKIEKFPEERRERFLSPEELERLGAAIREGETVGIAWREDGDAPKSKHLTKEENQRTLLSPDAAAALRLLIFTGARLREILDLRWEHVDLGRGLLLLPDSKTGRKTIVLNRPALEILQAHPRGGSFVISGARLDQPRADLKKPWSTVCRRAGLEGVRLHDRRSAAPRIEPNRRADRQRHEPTRGNHLRRDVVDPRRARELHIPGHAGRR